MNSGVIFFFSFFLLVIIVSATRGPEFAAVYSLRCTQQQRREYASQILNKNFLPLTPSSIPRSIRPSTERHNYLSAQHYLLSCSAISAAPFTVPLFPSLLPSSLAYEIHKSHTVGMAAPCTLALRSSGPTLTCFVSCTIALLYDSVESIAGSLLIFSIARTSFTRP